MSWQESNAMDERMRFIGECLSGDETRTALCARYGISRKTGYKWLERYEAFGPIGLEERSRAPLHHGLATPQELVERIVAEKEAHPSWGPVKVLARLSERDGSQPWPAVSTIGEILKRYGLVQKRRRARWRSQGTHPLTVPEHPNHVWSTDHKGWFRTRDGVRCEPLTVLDGFSRYNLALAATLSTACQEAWTVFERVFAEFGLPEILRSDNGVPFACVGISGLTSLAVRFIELGIILERIEPGRPTQNGAHERFHGTMLPLANKPEQDAQAQQCAFDAFRHEYNQERPHQALGQTPPARHYRPSPRSLPARTPKPDYPDTATKRQVRINGTIKWRGDEIFVSEALTGKTLAIEDNDQGEWLVRFYSHHIGVIDEKNAKLRRRSTGPLQGPGTAKPALQTGKL
jgi:putative transposase